MSGFTHVTEAGWKCTRSEGFSNVFERTCRGSGVNSTRLFLTFCLAGVQVQKRQATCGG